MKPYAARSGQSWTAGMLCACLLVLSGCSDDEEQPQPQAGPDAGTDAGEVPELDAGTDAGTQGSDGPEDQGPDFPHQVGDPASGKEVFRFETFGNEGFWTDAMRLPEGIVAAGLTPKQALLAGLSVDVEALDEATQMAVAAELAAQGTDGPLLNAPETTLLLLNANAVIGVVVKDTNGDGTLDVASGDKVGISCAACHAITDGSVLAVPEGGSIGKRIDGPTPHTLNVGAILALAANSRAYYPLLQVKLTAFGDTSIGRAPPEMGLTEASTEEEVDAYLSNPNYYPVGTFDDAPDGTGAPQHIAPFFRTDLSAPFGTPGDVAVLENFNNLVYTVLLDPTSLVTEGGRSLLMALLGEAAGTEMADDYLQILTDTGVVGPGGVVGEGFPYVTAAMTGTPGEEPTPVGLRVDEQKLSDLNAYTDSLQAPEATGFDAEAAMRGRDVFREGVCVQCHNVDQGRRVPSFIVPMEQLLLDYQPVILAERPVQLPFRPMAFSPIQNDTTTIFDDKTVVVDASRRGQPRGSALPLLLDLARKPNFLHDSSVATLDSLLDPSRGEGAPHAYYLTDVAQRMNVVEFLKSLDTTP